MELELLRTCYATGSNGCLFLEDELVCFTIEQPRIDGQGRSCIPEGRYGLHKTRTVLYGDHFMLDSVGGRPCTRLYATDDALQALPGSIAPVSLVTAAGKGVGSLKAMQALLRLSSCLTGPHYLTIKNAYV